MPNGRSHRSYEDYGPHSYPDHDGTSDCGHECGCWSGSSNSGGPVGLDPIHGHCPNNPLDGKKQPGKDDYEDCVNGRILTLEKELFEALKKAKIVKEARKNTKVDLQKRNIALLEENTRLKFGIKAMQRQFTKISTNVDRM